MVAAPGRESTTMFWPHFSVSFCPISRVLMSSPPPGANGTIMRIGRPG
jgi:hypothetical protein